MSLGPAGHTQFMTQNPPKRTEIDAREARLRLTELLDRVRAGDRFTITHRGKAVADLVPSETARPTAAAAIERFRALMRENPIAARAVEVGSLIDEGRA